MLGNNVIVKEFCETEYCVVDSNTYLGPRTQIRGAVIGKNCEIRAHASIAEGAVVGDECSIGEQSTIAPHVRIYPFKRVETGAHVQRSLIWQPRGASTLFTDEGVTGIVNVDITPETATRLAMAYGTALRSGDQIVASRDAHPASRMIKRAMIAGIVATGVSVEDLRVATARGQPLRGREHDRARRLPREDLRPRPRADPDHVLRGRTARSPATTTRKDVEKHFNRQELRRALLNQLGDLSFPPRVNEAYVNELLAQRRRRADPGRALPDRARLRLLERRARRCRSLLRSLRVESFSTHSVHGPGRAGDPGRRPARVHDRRRAGSSRRWARTWASCSTASAERIVLIDELAQRDPARHRAAPAGRAGLASTTPAQGTDRAARRTSRASRSRSPRRHGAEVVRARHHAGRADRGRRRATTWCSPARPTAATCSAASSPASTP